MENKKIKKETGFIQIIIIVIIAVVVLSLLGYNPEAIWKDIVLPILNWFWDLFIAILNLIVGVVSKVMQ